MAAPRTPGTLRDPGPITFEAVLQRTDASGAACFVDFPYDLKALYGRGNLVPVRVTWDGRVPYRGSLAKRGGAWPMVLCRKDVVAALGKGAGERVEVRVELDLAPRDVALPDALADALDARADAKAAWDGMSAACQREYSRWVAEAKRDETRARRVEETIARVAEGRRFGR